MLLFVIGSEMDPASLQSCINYLVSVCGSTDPPPPDSLHERYKKLHAVTGLYWIVCAWALLERLGAAAPDGMKELFRKKFQKVGDPANSPELFDMHRNGGPLRCLSRAQLLVLLFPAESEARRLGLQKLGIDAKYILESIIKPDSKTLNPPWWFDMRGMYCLITITSLAGVELSSSVRSALAEWIHASQNILGGFGAEPHAEAHGGYTFCATAALVQLGESIARKQLLLAWCRARSMNRFHGRPGKPSDSCYIWWIGATVNMLGGVWDAKRAEDFIINHCGVAEGGFSKFPSVPVSGDDSSVHGKQDADLFHTFLAIASLALNRGILDPITVLPKDS